MSWVPDRPPISKALSLACRKRDRYECQLRLDGCTGKATEADHIVPWYKGGSDGLENLRAVCWSCHRKMTLRQAAAAKAEGRAKAKNKPFAHPGIKE